LDCGLRIADCGLRTSLQAGRFRINHYLFLTSDI
jgi:hypothetical protein